MIFGSVCSPQYLLQAHRYCRIFKVKELGFQRATKKTFHTQRCELSVTCAPRPVIFTNRQFRLVCAFFHDTTQCYCPTFRCQITILGGHHRHKRRCREGVLPGRLPINHLSRGPGIPLKPKNPSSYLELFFISTPVGFGCTPSGNWTVVELKLSG